MDRTKKTLFLSASVAAMSVTLGGCWDDDEKTFDTKSSCSSEYSDCTEVRNPVQMTKKNAPRFETIEQCELKFGLGNCTIPNDGKISAIFSKLDACEDVYGQGACNVTSLTVPTEDEDGNRVTMGYVYSGRDSVVTGLAPGTTGYTSPGYSSGGVHPYVVYHPIFFPNTFFYPYTYGYWMGSPHPAYAPQVVGGSYYTRNQFAQTHPGTVGRYTGPSNPSATRGPASSGSYGSVSNPSSSTGSRAGTVSSGGSRAGGVGGTSSAGAGE